MMTELTAKTNPKVKHFVRLRSDASYRREHSCFVLEGLRLCLDAYLSGISIAESYVTQKALNMFGDELSDMLKDSKAYLITDEISDKMSDTQSPQGVFCIFKMLDKDSMRNKIEVNGKYIAAESIQNPSNLGAIARTAEALGISGLIVGGGCDIYNPKAQRAAMGSLLRLPVITADNLIDYLLSLKEQGFRVFGTVPDREAKAVTSVDFNAPCVSVIGNEANGLSDEFLKICTDRITVPMAGRAESLNASTAAAIIMWEMVR